MDAALSIIVVIATVDEEEIEEFSLLAVISFNRQILVMEEERDKQSLTRLWNTKDVQCYNCQKFGHHASYCWSKALG